MLLDASASSVKPECRDGRPFCLDNRLDAPGSAESNYRRCCKHATPLAENCDASESIRSQTAVCAGSSILVLSRDSCFAIGITACMRVPELWDSILNVPESWRTRSRMPRNPTPEPFD
jgi:hypothetical protein